MDARSRGNRLIDAVHHWRRMTLMVLTHVLNSYRLQATHVTSMRDMGISFANAAGRTVPRRAKWAGLQGLSRKTKVQLQSLCTELNIAFDGKETVEELTRRLYNYEPPDGELESGGKTRRPADPTMPGLGRLSKKQLQGLCERYEISYQESDTVNDLKTKLYKEKPRVSPPDYQDRSRAWMPTGASSSTSATATSSSSTGPPATFVQPTAKAKAKAKPKASPVQVETHDIAQDQEVEDITWSVEEEEIVYEAELQQAIDEQAVRLAASWTPQERAAMLAHLLARPA